ncbi:reverse transcriptase domain-containing protein [Tanacetum coccineum]
MHTSKSNSELVVPLPEPERTLNRRLRRRNRRVPYDQRNNPPQHPRVIYPPVLNINYFRHFLDILRSYDPMDDEPMWAADYVVAPTLGSAITIPETANEFTIKGNIIKIFYHGLSEITQEVLNSATDGIFLYKTPNQAYQLLEDKVLLKLDWAKNQKTKSSLKKIVAFADEGSSNSNTDKIMARMDAMTMKMDAQYKELQSNAKKTKPNLDEDYIPINTQPNPKGNNSKVYQPPQSHNKHVNAVFTRSGKSYNPPVNPNDQQNGSEDPINFDSDDEDKEPTPQLKNQNLKPFKETLLPKPYKPKIPYPQRLRKEKMEAQYGKFLDMIRAVRINVPLTDVLSGMPNYGKFLKELISNKHKIKQISAAFLSDESSAMIQNKVPPKLGDPESFFIPCNFNKTFSCNALADLGASINFMPYSLYAKLSLETIKSTKMSVRLADRSFQYPVGIAKNMHVEVGKFTFPADFVILIMEEDSKVPLILGRPFFHTADAVIRVKQKQLNLGVGTERMIFNIDSAMKHSYLNDDTCFSIDVIDEILEEYFDALLDEGSKILHSIEGTLLEEEIFAEFNEFMAMTADENSDPTPKIHHSKKSLSTQIIKSRHPLKNLLPILNLNPFLIIWNNKPLLGKDIPGIFPSFCKHKIQLLDDKKPAIQKQRRLNPNMQEVVKKEIVKLLDTGIIYPIADSPWVSPIHCVPKKCGITVVTNKNDELVPTRTVTGWRRLAGNKYFCFLDGFSGYFHIPIDPNDQEKTTFTCPFGTYTYRRMPFDLYNAPATFHRCMLAIFHDMIEESVEVFMDDFFIFGNSFDTCLNNLDKLLQLCKDAHLVLNWKKCHFMVKEGIVLGHKVSSAGIEVDKAKIDVISKLSPLLILKVLEAFSNIPNWNLPFELMCDARDFAVGAVLGQKDEFDIEIKDRKGTKNVAADHLSRIENDESSDDSKVDDNFSGETLMEIDTKDEHWFAEFANYLVGDIIPKEMTYQQKNKFFSDLKHYFWEEPYLFKVCSDEMIRRCISGPETRIILDQCHHRPTGPFSKSYKFEYILVAVDYVSKWAEAQALPTNDAQVVITFLKKLFCRFGMPKTLISDRGTHFCNKIMERTMKRYGVNHRFSTSYHPQTSGQVKNTNKALKRILEKSVKDNPAIWSRKLDDALWAFHTANKTHTSTTPYKLIYGKNCHLPFEIEHRVYWALKNYNPDLIAVGEKRVFQLHELDELRHQAYENSRLYKAITKVWHDRKLRMRKEFKQANKVMLFHSK